MKFLFALPLFAFISFAFAEQSSQEDILSVQMNADALKLEFSQTVPEIKSRSVKDKDSTLIRIRELKVDASSSMSTSGSPGGFGATVKLGINAKLNVRIDHELPFSTQTVFVNGKMGAGYEQPLFFGANGLRADKLKIKKSPWFDLEAFTTNDVHRGLGDRLLESITLNQVEKELPKKFAGKDKEINDTVNAAAELGKKQSQASLKMITNKLDDALPREFLGDVHLRYGAIGPNPMSALVGQSTQSCPNPPLRGDQLTRVVLNEGFMAAAVGPRVAGREIKFRDLKREICGNQSSAILDFCRQNSSELQNNGSVVFAEKNPIALSIRDGKVTLTFNGKFRLLTDQSHELTSSKIVQPEVKDKEKLVYETLPTSMDITYSASPPGISFESVKLRPVAEDRTFRRFIARQGIDYFGAKAPDLVRPLADRVAPAAANRDAPILTPEQKKIASDLLHTPSLTKAARDIIPDDIRGPAENKLIELAMEKQLKTSFDLPSFAYPVTISRAGNHAPRMEKTVYSYPSEVTAENGCLSVVNSFTTTPSGLGGLAGVRYEEVKKDGRKRLIVTSVSANAPIGVRGLKAGDEITGYAFPDQTIKTPGMDFQPFYDEINRLSSNVDSSQRRLTLKVMRTNDAGVREEKQIDVRALPSGDILYAQAMRVMNSIPFPKLPGI